ncbi:DUF4417 domain-containing protein [Bifidobacterium stellenboschense]|uniref:Uncharacterized protein n=1 Tax=Bifidobacterium stellenboschense TaxID=762211 RepID=A0A087DGE6_9BIFI|nr:DUF4417 domain-containing protein [Bifidobacterium stellenboschense]KFI94596.1 hypothetical protein BSTEL_1266 [Bifidobacterium stellenboschense]
MVIPHNTRAGCHDVFHASLLRDARYDSSLEFPWLKAESKAPNKLIPYSKAKYSKDTDQWVCFYEDDVKFDADTWDHPEKALTVLRRFRGTIAPDYSMFRDMPLIQQQWNNFRSKTIAHYWQMQGIPVLPNIRWADHRTWETACLGVPRCSNIAIGTLGCIKNPTNRKLLKEGLSYVIKRLSPASINVYGKAPDDIFSIYEEQGIRVIRFPSECEQAHRAGSDL